MKSIICWAVGIVLLFIGVTAVNMGEWVLAVVFGALAFGAVWAAPSGSKAGANR